MDIKLRKLSAEEVVFSIRVEDEMFETPDKHFLSGKDDPDEEITKEMVAGIKKRAYRGDPWAWCTVIIEAKWISESGVEIYTGSTCLGCCSYDNEKDFKENSGYHEDMLGEALIDLNQRIEMSFLRMKPLLSIDSRVEDTHKTYEYNPTAEKCESCSKVLTDYDIGSYQNGNNCEGIPAVCEDCAEGP